MLGSIVTYNVGSIGTLFQWTMAGFMLGSRLKMGHYRLSSQHGNNRRELHVYASIFPDTMDTYESVLGYIVTKLMPLFVSSAGTARGAKKLIFPGVDSTPYSL